MKNKKTIAIVYNTTFYVYKFRMKLIQELQRLGYSIVVFSPTDEYTKKLEENGITHYPINMSQYGMNPLKELRTTFEMYIAFRKYQPAFSLHYTIKPNIFGSIAARIANVNVINNVAGAGKAFSNEKSLFSKFVASLYKIGLSKSKKVFFQNNDDMQLFLNKCLVEKSIAERIPGSGVDLLKYKALQPNTIDNSFLFVGRLLIEKGIHYYLEAALKVIIEYPEAKFGIVGELEKNKDYIDETILNKYLKHEQITYYGTVSPDKMPKIIENHSCIVLPSYYREGVPRSLLEAASFSKAIITTDSVGCREVVDEGINGFLCPIKDSSCLVKAMQKYINLSEHQKIELGKNGRIKMEKEFDERYVLDAYMKFIRMNEK